jgi:hypothetical protein
MRNCTSSLLCVRVVEDVVLPSSCIRMRRLHISAPPSPPIVKTPPLPAGLAPLPAPPVGTSPLAPAMRRPNRPCPSADSLLVLLAQLAPRTTRTGETPLVLEAAGEAGRGGTGVVPLGCVLLDPPPPTRDKASPSSTASLPEPLLELLRCGEAPSSESV